MTATPTLDLEHQLLASGARWVIGCDEVGRGAIAGPVAVGVAAITTHHRDIPQGLRDSKLLSERARTSLAPLAAQWAPHSAVGLTSAADIDHDGIITALGAAAVKALGRLFTTGVDPSESVILLDGTHDWLTRALPAHVRVIVRPKADRDCGAVAAASVISKVHRDQLMIDADTHYPPYGWARNKGYGAAAHLAAIETHGPTPLHRHTWLRPTLPLAAAEFSGNA